MHRFLIGFWLPFAVCSIFVVTDFSPFEYESSINVAALGVLLLALPIVAAMPAVSLIHARWPRRWLIPTLPGRFRAALCGVAAGMLAIPLIGAGLCFANRPFPWAEDAESDWYNDVDRVHDAFVVAPVCFVIAGLASWLMPMREPGVCAACGYDVRYSLESGRCPECGRAI